MEHNPKQPLKPVAEHAGHPRVNVDVSLIDQKSLKGQILERRQMRADFHTFLLKVQNSLIGLLTMKTTVCLESESDH